MASNTSPWLALGLCLAAGFASAMPPPEGAPPLLSAREQVAEANAILDERLETLLPALMAETGFDAWLVLGLNIPALVTIILCYVWFGLNDWAAILAVIARAIVPVAVRSGVMPVLVAVNRLLALLKK